MLIVLRSWLHYITDNKTKILKNLEINEQVYTSLILLKHQTNNKKHRITYFNVSSLIHKFYQALCHIYQYKERKSNFFNLKEKNHHYIRVYWFQAELISMHSQRINPLTKPIKNFPLNFSSLHFNNTRIRRQFRQ